MAKLNVQLEWREELGERWMNIDNLKALLFGSDMTLPELLEVIPLDLQNSGLQERVEELTRTVKDFMSYFDPKGGVSDVPRGPFDRAAETLGLTSPPVDRTPAS